MNAVFFRGVAQVVERLVRDQEAAGSSPVTPTNDKARVIRFQALALLIRKMFVCALFLPCSIDRFLQSAFIIRFPEIHYEALHFAYGTQARTNRCVSKTKRKGKADIIPEIYELY